MSSKVRIELSCTEKDLLEAVIETKLIMESTKSATQSLKVFSDIISSESGGHYWMTVKSESSPLDLVKIYELEKQLKELNQPKP